jgi:hypothetical protein
MILGGVADKVLFFNLALLAADLGGVDDARTLGA